MHADSGSLIEARCVQVHKEKKINCKMIEKYRVMSYNLIPNHVLDRTNFN